MLQENGRAGHFWNCSFVVALLGYFFLYMSVSLLFLLPLFLGQFNMSKSRVRFIMGVHSVMAISLYLSLFDVGTGLGSPFFGWISDGFGYRKMHMAAGVFLLASTLVFTARAPRTETDGAPIWT